MQPGEFRGEVVIEVDAEFAADLVLANDGVAKQARDQGAPQAVIFAEADSRASWPCRAGRRLPYSGTVRDNFGRKWNRWR